jgi:hypothetical protein
MTSLVVSSSFKCQWVSYINIMITCMNCHETSLPPHLMIPIAFILPHPVSSIMLNLSPNFTPYLFHQPRTIL